MTRPPDVEHPGVLITGPLGSGKTTVAVEMGHLLGEIEEPVAVIDLDWLAWIHVPEGSSAVPILIAENLGAIWANYERIGIRRLVMARTLHEAREVETIARAIPHVELQVVHLSVSASTREARLRSRDIGRERDENIQEAGTMADLDPGGLTVDNDGRPVREVAQEILTRLGWPPEPR